MKKFRNLFFAAICGLMAVATLSSCLNDGDDDETLTIEQQRTYGSQMTGTYSGMMRFYKPKTSNTVTKYDSIQSSWNVSADTTVSISYFPINKLDSAIVVPATDNTTDANKYRELQQAIKEITPQTLKCNWYIPYASYVQSSLISFLVNPHTIMKTLTYGGKTHNVYFIFLGGTYYSRGEFSMTDRSFQFQMMLYGIYEDAVTTANAIPSNYFNTIYVLCSKK